MNTPAVSVVTVSYNVANYIGQAIQSALSQSFRDFELIVLDDGSTDATLDVVRQISDPRIRVEPRLHRGASAALSDGVALARAPPPNKFVPQLMPICSTIGPDTMHSGATLCVVACTPARLKDASSIASTPASTTGK